MPILSVMKRIRFESSSRPRHRSARKPLAVLACFVGSALAGSAGATDLNDDRFTLRGFGTAAATYHDADGIEFRRNVGQAKGLPSDELGLYTDSVAGVQINAAVSEQVDVVLQSITQLNADGEWRPRISQGFIRYSPDESLVFRVGRISYDIYLLAESRQVGYSYSPVRPSTEFYGLINNDEIDGADVSLTRRVGPGLARARLFGGTSSGAMAFDDGTHSDLRGEMFGAVFDYTYRGWTARLAVARFQFDSGAEITPLVAALRSTGIPQAVAIGDDLGQDVYKSSGVQLGVAYDDGPLQAQLLLGGIDSDSIAGPDTINTYALFGYRLRRFTPFASFSRARDRAAIKPSGLPDFPMFAPLNGAVQTIQARTRSTGRTTSIGLRYDFSSHLDFKLQLDRVNLTDAAVMFDRRPQPRGEAHMNVAAIAVDFVF
jgi:hypothetical protein